MPMNEEIKGQWLAALRSGDYKQGTGSLRKSDANDPGVLRDQFCCLGVLCELAVKAGAIPAGLLDDGRHSYRYGEQGDGGYLPFEVVAWSGLLGENPVAVDRALSYLNDRGNDFAAIADVIERNL